ncbi:hypothetical protein DMENIID0001_131880 [Sergentomyia squamirostris]
MSVMMKNSTKLLAQLIYLPQPMLLFLAFLHNLTLSLHRSILCSGKISSTSGDLAGSSSLENKKWKKQREKLILKRMAAIDSKSSVNDAFKHKRHSFKAHHLEDSLQQIAYTIARICLHHRQPSFPTHTFP